MKARVVAQLFYNNISKTAYEIHLQEIMEVLLVILD